MPRQLEIRTSKNGEEVMLSLTGDLDLASAPSLERAFGEAEAEHGPAIVVDLSGLEFMDSTGLQSLIAAFKRAKADGYALRLRRGPQQVQRVFELTSTVELFEFED